MATPKIAFFASGNGTNVEAILMAIASGALDAEAVALICDNKNAPVLARASVAQLPTLVLAPKDCPSRTAWEETMRDFAQQHGAEWLVLAGFMRILGAPLLDAYPERIVNIHPSLLPKHPGRHGIEDAFNAGDRWSGVTIHYVDAGIDSGQPIVQERVYIEPDWSVDEFEQHIHDLEHRLYPRTIQRLLHPTGEEK